MSIVNGKNCMLYQFDAFWKPWVCGTDCSLVTSTEFIETSITGEGKDRTIKPSARTWEGSFNGLVYLQMANTLALPDIRLTERSGTKILVRFQRIDDSGNTYIDEGYAYILNVSDSGTNNATATFSAQLKGTGKLTQIFTPTIVNPNGKVKRYQYTGIGGENLFTASALNLRDVIEVVVDGIGRCDIITSGTPVNEEAKYTSAGGLGRIDLPQTLAPGTKVYVLYQDL